MQYRNSNCYRVVCAIAQRCYFLTDGISSVSTQYRTCQRTAKKRGLRYVAENKIARCFVELNSLR